MSRLSLLLSLVGGLPIAVRVFGQVERRGGLRGEVVGGQEVGIAGDERVEIRPCGFPLPQLHLHQPALVAHLRLLRRQFQGAVVVV